MKIRPRNIAPWWRRFKRNGYQLDRCEHCGHGFRWSKDARHSFGNRDGKVFHSPCISYKIARRQADDRLAVLGVVMEVSGLTPSEVQTVIELRETDCHAFSVFHDLSKVAS